MEPHYSHSLGQEQSSRSAYGVLELSTSSPIYRLSDPLDANKKSGEKDSNQRLMKAGDCMSFSTWTCTLQQLSSPHRIILSTQQTIVLLIKKEVGPIAQNPQNTVCNKRPHIRHGDNLTGVYSRAALEAPPTFCHLQQPYCWHQAWRSLTTSIIGLQETSKETNLITVYRPMVDY